MGEVSRDARRGGRRWLLVAAASIVVLAIVLLAVAAGQDPDSIQADTVSPTTPTVTSILPDATTPTAPVVSVVGDATAPAPVTNGWVAFDTDRRDGPDIYLVRPGEDAHRLEVAGLHKADEACPAWSPNGTRLLFGRSTESTDITQSVAELVIVRVGSDGVAGAPRAIALDGFGALEGFDPHPCGTWAPDGRWVALRGPNEVWVVDTQTSEIRRLPDLRPNDLEWRPGTDQLAIAGDIGMTRAEEVVNTPVTLYSVSTGELRQLGTVQTKDITWSPDGSTLAYTGLGTPGYQRLPSGLWLVDADGTNERILVGDLGEAVHGIGPVWSPTGDRIAYQRRCCGRFETHEVVLVSVADGTETVIEPPKADGSDDVAWYPFTVSWSPDGATLLYSAWRDWVGSFRDVDGRGNLITVAADTPNEVTVLALGGSAFYNVTQMWGRQPD